MRRFSIERIKHDERLRTRDGREVVAWREIKDPSQHLWPIEVDVRERDGHISTYIVNQNGQRYINIKSADDIYIRDQQRNDTMPDVFKAIEAVQRGDMQGVRLANKTEKMRAQPIEMYSVEMGYNGD
jgi:hypothetical protein